MKLQGQRVIPPLNQTRAFEDAERVRAWNRANLEGGSWKAAGRVDEVLRGLVEPVPGTVVHEIAREGAGRFEVWQRQLSGGDWALLLFNNNLPTPTSITCDGACWARMGWTPSQSVAVRDVVARADNGTAVGSFSAVVRTNATVLVRLSAA